MLRDPILQEDGWGILPHSMRARHWEMRTLWINTDSIVTPERNNIPLWNQRLAAPPKVLNLGEFSHSVAFFLTENQSGSNGFSRHFTPKALPAGCERNEGSLCQVTFSWGILCSSVPGGTFTSSDVRH